MENEVKKINVKNVTFDNLQDFMQKNNIHYFFIKPEQSFEDALANQQWIFDNEKGKKLDEGYIIIERSK